jgi:hypothetical protein
MDVRLVSVWTDELILSTFGIHKFVHPRSVLCESQHSSFKKTGPSDDPKTQNGDVLENFSSNFD